MVVLLLAGVRCQRGVHHHRVFLHLWQHNVLLARPLPGLGRHGNLLRHDHRQVHCRSQFRWSQISTIPLYRILILIIEYCVIYYLSIVWHSERCTCNLYIILAARYLWSVQQQGLCCSLQPTWRCAGPISPSPPPSRSEHPASLSSPPHKPLGSLLDQVSHCLWKSFNHNCAETVKCMISNPL